MLHTMLVALTCVAVRTWPSVSARAPTQAHAPHSRARRLVAQGGWVRGVDPSGQAYYFNEHTGQSQWEPPPQATSQAPVLWRLAAFSGVAGFSSGGILEKPEDQLPYSLRCGDERVLSRWNMVRQRLTVSRIQGVVHVVADGTAVLVSRGRGPTLWREGYGAPWRALYKDESQVLSSGDQVSLDCNDPEAAVFSCEQEGALPRSGYEQQGQQQLPHPWLEQFDQDGRVFYSNPQTGVAQWDRPF